MVVYSVYSTRNEKSEIERSSEEYFEGSSQYTQYTVTTVRVYGHNVTVSSPNIGDVSTVDSRV